MARVPIPAKPTLFKTYKGGFAIHYPSIRSNGAATLGAYHLKGIKDEPEAKKALRTWVEGGEYERAVELARSRVRQRRISKVNGHDDTSEYQKPMQVKKARQTSGSKAKRETNAIIYQQLQMITVQLQALALSVEMMTKTIGSADG